MPTRRQMLAIMVASATALQVESIPALNHWTRSTERTHAMTYATTISTPVPGPALSDDDLQSVLDFLVN